MNFKNIWNHPKTSAAGLLIAVASIAGVLSQQGVSLGKVGTGTAVSLASALATALLGLLAKDPSSATSPTTIQPVSASASQQAKLGAWMLIALVIPLPWMQGCTAAGVAEDIVNWTPPLQSAVATVDSTAALLAPADAPIFNSAEKNFRQIADGLLHQAAEIGFGAHLPAKSAGSVREEARFVEEGTRLAGFAAKGHVFQSSGIPRLNLRVRRQR